MRRSRQAKQVPARLEIRSVHYPTDHVAIFMEIEGYPAVSMTFGSPDSLAQFLEDLCSAAEKVWPRGPASMENDTEEYTDLGACCACGKVGPSVCNIYSLPYLAPMAGSGWGCVVCGLPPDGAIAVLCVECHEMQRPPLSVCVGAPGQNQRIDLCECMPKFDHDMSKHAEE